MSAQGKLYVFEGMDSVGKTTLSKRLAIWLNEQGQPTQWLSFPGKEPGSVGALIYEIHHTPSTFGVHQMTELANQFLHLSAHVDAIESTILPNLAAGANVVLDRFWWSAIVYGPKEERNAAVLSKAIEAEKILWGNILPDAIFLLKRTEPFDRTFDVESWVRMQQEYLRLAADEKQKTFVVENADSLDTTFDSILAGIASLPENH